MIGGYIADWHFLFYWGYVVPERSTPFTPGEEAFTAAMGNVVSLALGFGAILWTVRQPINAAWNYARLEVARIMLWLTLVIYPAMSLLLRAWDFHIIRTQLNEATPYVGDGLMVLYAGFAVWIWRKWQGPWRRKYVWLATPLFDQWRAAEQRIAANPENVEALRELGRLHLSGDDASKALAPLRRALEVHPEEPETHFLTGLAHLRAGEPREASEHLRTAGRVLEEQGPDPEHDDLYFEITLGLATARLALPDPQGALRTVQEAESQRPRDPRSTLLHADALAAAGRSDDARTHLEQALEGAHGRFASEIKRRLKGLGQ
jgi:tetratricopeptide (TPR) repeat protein